MKERYCDPNEPKPDVNPHAFRPADSSFAMIAMSADVDPEALGVNSRGGMQY